MKREDRKCRQARVCAQCEFEQERMLDPVTAAFEHGREWRDPCPKCGSKQFRSTTCVIAALSSEQLAIWASDKKACFLYQDEQSFLEREENLDLLIEYFGKPSTLRQRKKRLLAAILAVLYRASVPGGENMSVVDRVIAALSEQRALVNEIGTRHISGVILKRVRPHLITRTRGHS